MATMVAAGPARWDVTADPIRPQNSQAKGGPSSTVPVPVPAAAATAAAAAATQRLTAGFFSLAPTDSAHRLEGAEPRQSPPVLGGEWVGPLQGPPRPLLVLRAFRCRPAEALSRAARVSGPLEPSSLRPRSRGRAA